MDEKTLKDLSAEFPQERISWRPQGKPYNGKCRALAYIDARDVMNRLDQVVGAQMWQDSYVETPTGRVICTLSIWDFDHNRWVDKSDGAGDTDVEGEKGAISDAFKRAAVKWGIGRYLYDTESPYVKCELTSDGKWKDWAENPWTKIGQNKGAVVQSLPGEEYGPDDLYLYVAGKKLSMEEYCEFFKGLLSACENAVQIEGVVENHKKYLNFLRQRHTTLFEQLKLFKQETLDKLGGNHGKV